MYLLNNPIEQIDVETGISEKMMYIDTVLLTDGPYSAAPLVKELADTPDGVLQRSILYPSNYGANPNIELRKAYLNASKNEDHTTAADLCQLMLSCYPKIKGIDAIGAAEWLAWMSDFLVHRSHHLMPFDDQSDAYLAYLQLLYQNLAPIRYRLGEDRIQMVVESIYGIEKLLGDNVPQFDPILEAERVMSKWRDEHFINFVERNR